MLIGHIGALIAIITFIISIMAYSYAHDAYEVDKFEHNCFRTILGCFVVDAMALVLKDYSVMFVFDYLQLLVDSCVAYMLIRLYYILYMRNNG